MSWRILPPGLYQQREESRLAVGGDLLGMARPWGLCFPPTAPISVL